MNGRPLPVRNKEKACYRLRLISKNFFTSRVNVAIKQFTDGLETVGGLWTMIKENADSYKDVFCYQALRLTRKKFKALCKVNHSEPGSNKYQKEQETLYVWEDYLFECEGRLNTIRIKLFVHFCSHSYALCTRLLVGNALVISNVICDICFADKVSVPQAQGSSRTACSSAKLVCALVAKCAMVTVLSSLMVERYI